MELSRRYPFEHYQTKARRYAGAVRWLYGVRLDTTTQDRWAQAIALARSVDTYLDDNPLEGLSERVGKVKALLEQPDPIIADYPDLAPGRLGSQMYGRLARNAASILDANLGYKLTSDPNVYISQRRKEGAAYADLITGLATPPVAAQPGYAAYASDLRRLGEVTNLANSMHGVRGDYARGELTMCPGPFIRPLLLGAICVAACARESLQPSQSEAVYAPGH